jgi:hypothetical protein
MTRHSHPTELLDRAEIDRAINRAKALRAETFRTCFGAFIRVVRTAGRSFSVVKTFKSAREWKGTSQINAS